MQPFHPSTPAVRSRSPAYFDSPDAEKESHIGSEIAAQQARNASNNAVKEYEEKRSKLDSAVEQLEYLVAELKNTNRQDWVIRYPCLSSPSEGASSSSSSRPSVGPRRMTYADDPANPVDVIYQAIPASRRTFRRTLTMAPTNSPAQTDTNVYPAPDACLNRQDPPTDDFSILRLDINIGADRHAKTIINRLEKASIAALLENRFDGTLEHLVSLRKRINDPHSRVLVTGDLNAGKSTFVNALLRRREIMPTDEQPLTTRFVEVVNATENDNVEEVHIQNPALKYDPKDRGSFTTEPIERLSELVADFDGDMSSSSLTVYLKGIESSATNPSILHNDVVDISLIDAPGLNRDSIKTTANFARQEEIDVVVFVVSAANHFTLSAKEFIWQAGHEKAHLFIVVNRFDQIRDKERCRRLVLDQIKHLSPETYRDAADLVHFVDSAKIAFGLDDDGGDFDDAFCHLEHSLRSFVLVNRSQSKLGPAQTYSLRLLSDIELLASANSIVAAKERDAAREDIARIKPSLDRMKKGRDALDQSLSAIEEGAVSQSSTSGKQLMQQGLERIGRGELATNDPGFTMPAYPGLLGAWHYAQATRKELLRSLDHVVELAQNEVRALTAQSITEMEAIGTNHMPDNAPASNRQFRSENMFSRRVNASTVAGLGLANQSQLLVVTTNDILNLSEPWAMIRSQSSTPSRSLEIVPFGAEASGIGAASLAIGAFSMLNGKSKSLLDSVIRVAELASSPAAKKWAGPIVGALVLGATAYIIYDLPQSIPRNIGRQLQAYFAIESGLESDLGSIPLSDALGLHLSKETRKVMRIGAWGIMDRHRVALVSRAEAMKASQAAERRALDALNHFSMVDRRVQDIRGLVDSVKV